MLGFKALEWELFPSNLSGLCWYSGRLHGDEKAEKEQSENVLMCVHVSGGPQRDKQSTSHDISPAGGTRRCCTAVDLGLT